MKCSYTLTTLAGQGTVDRFRLFVNHQEQEPLIRMAAVQSPIHPSVAHVRSRPLSSVYSGNLVSAEMSVAS